MEAFNCLAPLLSSERRETIQYKYLFAIQLNQMCEHADPPQIVAHADWADPSWDQDRPSTGLVSPEATLAYEAQGQEGIGRVNGERAHT